MSQRSIDWETPLDHTKPCNVVAGIDEAGLGPMLGPLTLGVAAFRVPQGRADMDLWHELSAATCAERPKDERLWVADSKAVFDRSARGMARLESTALAFLAQQGDGSGAPATPADLLSRGPGQFPSDTPALRAHPWYAQLPQSLPTAANPERLARQSAQLADALRKAGVGLVEAGLRLVPTAQLNASFDATGSKARTAWDQVALALTALWTAYGSEGLLVWVDRQGARKRYAPLLAELCPQAEIRTLKESSLECVYRLQGQGRHMELRFAVRAEEQALPVALASCLAKYGRELAMDAFNAYFHARSPKLRPTAGYVVDARRWLDDAKQVLIETPIPPRSLVRER